MRRRDERLISIAKCPRIYTASSSQIGQIVAICRRNLTGLTPYFPTVIQTNSFECSLRAWARICGYINQPLSHSLSGNLSGDGDVVSPRNAMCHKCSIKIPIKDAILFRIKRKTRWHYGSIISQPVVIFLNMDLQNWKAYLQKQKDFWPFTTRPTFGQGFRSHHQLRVPSSSSRGKQWFSAKLYDA